MSKGLCYCFLGPELGEKKEAIDAVRTRLKKEYGEAPEETSFYIGESDVSEVVSFALNGSLFSSCRMIFVKNAELIKKKDEVASLAAYIKSPGDGDAVFFISEQTKIENALEKCFTGENKKIFWELFEEKKTQYLERFFKQAGCVIESEAVSLILEYIENNTDALRQECSKIALYVKSKGSNTINTQIIEQLLVHSKQETVFSLFSAIAGADFARSISVARALFASKTEPQMIFGFLAPAFRKLRDYCELAARGADSDFELKKIGISTLGKKDYYAARRAYGDAAADAMLAITAEYDIAIRANSRQQELIMDMYLYQIYKLYLNRHSKK
ncbi:MAG: DNA polymerase III subunit delta [Spirochaetaceae bacterium]|jgi:DNA polymerase-3 subunit delta|nr:DNA polymerase III subunit delta [Spirochaetaceae bacterium]